MTYEILKWLKDLLPENENDIKTFVNKNRREPKAPKKDGTARTLSDLSSNVVFFDSEHTPFVWDKPSDKMYLMVREGLKEITALDVKLKIAIESPVISRSKAIRMSKMPSISLPPQ